VEIHHGDEAEIQERQKAPFLACQMSKWFYDTSTGAATGATHCDSFVGEGFNLLVIS
jgi:hypothetical protein